ncbi:O-linked GlcNAc transferase, partial [Mesorhizobium sp. M1322]
AEARRSWSRYLELDANSEWASIAIKGIQFVYLQLARMSA